jgi:hypothetical protein
LPCDVGIDSVFVRTLANSIFVGAKFDVDATARYLESVARSTLNVAVDTTIVGAATNGSPGFVGEFETNNEKVCLLV